MYKNYPTSVIREWLQNHVVPGCPGQLLSVLAGLVQEKMGGSSGAVGVHVTWSLWWTRVCDRSHSLICVSFSCIVCFWLLQLDMWPRGGATLRPGPVQCMLGHRPWEGDTVCFILCICIAKRMVNNVNRHPDTVVLTLETEQWWIPTFCNLQYIHRLLGQCSDA